MTGLFPIPATAEDAKYSKHLSACNATGYNFVDFGADCFGVLAPEVSKVLNRIAHILESFKSLTSY